MVFVSTGRGENFFTELDLFTSLKLPKVILDMLGGTLLVLTSKMERTAKDISGCSVLEPRLWQERCVGREHHDLDEPPVCSHFLLLLVS